jgi:hypothetical protein
VDRSITLAGNEPFTKLAKTLLRHQEGLLNYCPVRVRFEVVDAATATSRLCEATVYKSLPYLLLNAKWMAKNEERLLRPLENGLN